MQVGEPTSVPPTSSSSDGQYVLVDLVEVVTGSGGEKRQRATGRRQYVNLDASTDPSAPHPEFGRFVQLKARVTWDSGITSKSPGGQTVYFSCTPGSSNRGGLTGDDRSGFDSPGGGNTKSATTDGEGWTPIVKFNLSRYGGDEFQLSASLESTSGDGELKTGTYVVWRRLFYDVLEMKTADGLGKYELTPAIQGRVITAYEDVFIELKDTGKRALGAYKDNFDTVEKGFQWADPYCTADGVPLKLHICVVDHAAPYTGPYGSELKRVEEDATASPFRSNTKIYPYDFSGYTWIVKREYLDGTTWKPFTGAITMVGTRGDRQFDINFAGTSLVPTAAKPIKVRLSYLQAGKYGGWGGADSLHLLICRGTYEEMMSKAAADRQIIVACIHEPGHAMGLVDTGAAWHDSHHSGHCIHTSCAMWFESTPGNERFHPESVSDPGCRTALRQRSLDKNAMQTAWKFPR